ncbi:MAG TPA: prolyl oligopeptidase family serine peptidase, partial [Anaerolineales bacterium]|nr:prolyl oligopeptidase family serine peptidase [Anaerolineales bacterium]
MPHLFDLHSTTEHLALLRSASDGRYRIELRTLKGQPLGEIPDKLLPLESQWSPDGATLAFGSNDGLLYLYRLEDAEPTVVFADKNLQAGFCEWALDGNHLFFSAYNPVAHTPPNIYALALDTGHPVPLTNDPNAVDRFPHVSPSGQWVAFRRQFLDEPERPRWLYKVEVSSGQCFPILNPAEGDLDIGRFSWSPDSSHLLVTRLTLPQKEWGELLVVRLADQAIVWRHASETVRGGAFSPQGDRILCICTDELLWFAYPEGTLLHRLSLASLSPVRISQTGPQVGFDRDATTVYFVGENVCLYRWQIGGPCECLLDENPPTRPAFTHEEYRVPARDGRLIPVQRFIPPQPRAPAILYVHGGPYEAIDPDDPFMLRLLAEGVEFICVAYRGSEGYGLEHAEANRGEFGRADVWDLLAAGFDWKKRTGEDRPLILAGYSYGGFLTFLALAQDEIPWAGGITLYAASGILAAHQHHAYPSDPAQLAQARMERSPLAQAGRIRVPLLIFHGALDTVATNEEMQTIQASVISGGGTCELFIYEDDTHGLRRHRDEIHALVLNFLRRFE